MVGLEVRHKESLYLTEPRGQKKPEKEQVDERLFTKVRRGKEQEKWKSGSAFQMGGMRSA